MENKSNIRQIDIEKKAFTYIGKRYFCFKGKFSFKPRAIGLPIYLTLIIYNFSHSIYLLNKYIIDDIYFIVIISTSFILFILQIFQSLYTAFTNPGAFVPNNKEDNINYSEKNLMLATIKGQDYFLKICKKCKIPKDLRVFHCKECGLCILRHDHHCPWLSTCIGINNNRRFIMLLIINLIFFVYNPTVLFLFLYQRINKEDIGELNKTDKLCVCFLLIFNLFLLLFHMVLILSHSIYIGTGQTTSERLKRNENDNGINPFSKDSCCENMTEFWKYPMKYRERIKYNDIASKFVDTNMLINDFLSGEYYYTDNGKVISKTFIHYGYNYPKDKIELMDKLSPLNSTKENSINDS